MCDLSMCVSFKGSQINCCLWDLALGRHATHRDTVGVGLVLWKAADH